ncbi:MAG: restriction endonuclease subunit S [Ignavibacteriae bacterium]|nr:restriction endonuclease subunit S [Ignavibacteriota bacterium]
MIKYRVGEIVKIKKGKKVNQIFDKPTKNSKRFIQIDDLRNDNNLKYTTEDGVEVKKQDIIIAWDGANAGTVSFGLEGIIGSTLASLNVIDSNVLPELVGKVLQSKYQFLRDNTNGATIPHIKRDVLEDIEFIIPKDKKNQQNIVVLLDKADSIRKKRKETIKLADEFLRSTFLEMFGDPVQNPFNWNELPFKKLAKEEDNAIRRGPFGSSLRKDIFVPEGYLVYEQYHALNNDFSYQRYFIDENKFEELKAFKVQPGDFIISCSGVYLGKLAEVPQDSPIGVINQALLKITLDKSVINNKYFKFVFSYRGIQNRMFSSQRGSGIPNFPPMSVVNEFMFPIPPPELQNKFAEIVEKTEKLKEKYQQSLEESENLFNSLMQRAFKGEL